MLNEILFRPTRSRRECGNRYGGGEDVHLPLSLEVQQLLPPKPNLLYDRPNAYNLVDLSPSRPDRRRGARREGIQIRIHGARRRRICYCYINLVSLGPGHVSRMHNPRQPVYANWWMNYYHGGDIRTTDTDLHRFARSDGFSLRTRVGTHHTGSANRLTQAHRVFTHTYTYARSRLGRRRVRCQWPLWNPVATVANECYVWW